MDTCCYICVLCTVTQNGHVLLQMCLVHWNTKWAHVVRDVFCAFIVKQNGHVLLDMCSVHCNTEWTRVVRDVFCAL